jgi:hypothetical protein
MAEGQQNEEPAKRNLIIDGAAGGETKRRHDVTFPLLSLHSGKDRVGYTQVIDQSVVPLKSMPGLTMQYGWQYSSSNYSSSDMMCRGCFW